MYNSTTDVYRTKREIVNFSRDLVPRENVVESKFVTGSIYGILRSGSVVLKDIATAINEPIQIKNTIDRLSKNLNRPLSSKVQTNYTRRIINTLGNHPIILVDDTDVIKPHGKKFESLGRVRDGSSKNNKIEKGYLVTEMVGLTARRKQPVSLFTHIHSSAEKGYKSTNVVLLKGLRQVIGSLPKKVTATFVFDRGYDMNKLFNFMHRHGQNLIVRLTERRKLFWKGKWFKSTTLRDSRKGKIKTTLTFKKDGKKKKVRVSVSHLNVKITAGKDPINLVLVYGLGEVPMMLATNRVIRGKEDVINIVRTYMSRWRIEEYFRFKKQHFGFENFRVRSLRSINNLNQLLTYAIGLLGILAEKMDRSQLPHLLVNNARGLRRDILFYYYRLAEGILLTLAYAKEGVRGWFNIRRNYPRQLMLEFAC